MEPLLTSLRVLDLCGGEADAVTRLLADLGADVVKITPPGSESPAQLPTLDGVSIPFALHNANKRIAVLDPDSPADRRRLIALAGEADIVVDSGMPGLAARFGTGCDVLAGQFPGLVTMSVTDFGRTGPRADWHATDPVLYALSTALSRSGPTTGTPVLPPDGIASATAAVQAAWAVLVAYYNRLLTGVGDDIDFARFDAVVLALDPPFGTQGQAATARTGVSRWRGRPKNQDLYPIFRCRDGHVRICVLSPRQWHGLRAWLGEPARFADPRYDTIAARVADFGELSALIDALFADRTMAQLVEDGQAHGVPIAAVLSPSAAWQSEHLRAVGAVTETELGQGVWAQVPAGYWVVDGDRAGLRSAPRSSEPVWESARFSPPPVRRAGGRPLDGIRVVDLGIIVAGGELSRLFGDLGAEVIKVESSSYPDGLRQKKPGQAISEAFARAHRNNLGLGLELRTPEGAALFERLVAGSDALFANFKPGTLAALGFGEVRLRDLNPSLVVAESSAFGDTGPWSTRMGYGPLVRASTGVTSLWVAAEEDSAAGGSAGGRHPFYDATTVFPDHVVGRITALGALGGLIRRVRTGAGARIHVSQAEAVINQLDTRYVMLAAEAAGASVVEPDVEHLVLACAGDDEWLVVSLACDEDRRTVAAIVGASGGLADWAARRSPREAAEVLQSAGIAAAPMQRAEDVHDDPQLRARAVLTDMSHPDFEVPLPSESGPAPYRNIPPAPQRPAPLPGADTRRVCSEILGLADEEISRLLDDGVVFATADRKEVPQ